MNAFKSPSIHRTPLYRAKAAYCGMQARCLNKNGKNPTYADVELRMSRDEWLKWAVPQYEVWQKEHPNQKPNAARIGDSGHYELGNVRIVSQTENCMEQACRGLNAVQPNGTKRCSTCKEPRPVGEFYKNRDRWDGLASDCKSCIREYNRKRKLAVDS